MASVMWTTQPSVTPGPPESTRHKQRLVYGPVMPKPTQTQLYAVQQYLQSVKHPDAGKLRRRLPALFPTLAEAETALKAVMSINPPESHMSNEDQSPATQDEVEGVVRYLSRLKQGEDATPEGVARSLRVNETRAEAILDELSLNTERWEELCKRADQLAQDKATAKPKRERRGSLPVDEQKALVRACVEAVRARWRSRVGYEDCVPTSAVLGWIRGDEGELASLVRGFPWWASASPHKQNDLVQQAVKKAIAGDYLTLVPVQVNGRTRKWYGPVIVDGKAKSYDA